MTDRRTVHEADKQHQLYALRQGELMESLALGKREKRYNASIPKAIDSMMVFFLRTKKASITKARETNC